MDKTAEVAVLIAVCCLLAMAACSAYALDPMWPLQAVGPTGLGTDSRVNADFENPDNQVIVEGIALAGSYEILDPNGYTPYVHAYTVFLQQDGADKGGIQAWAGAWLYGTTLWPIYRSTSYIDFEAGDRLRITGFLNDAGRGKVVINHRHSTTPDLAFTVEKIGHPGLPDPALIPTVSDCNYFDQARLGGGERYQTRYVMISDVEITGATWGNDQLLTLSDATGSVGMKLSATGDFNSFPQPTGKVNVVGIFDQEDTSSPHDSGYRLWVKKHADIAQALDFCRQVRDCSDGDRVALVNKVVTRVYDGFFYIADRERVGGVRIQSDRSYEPGDMVCVQGVVSTADDEKIITPKYLAAGRANAEPLFVTSPTLWAQDGLDVYGSLVRCCVTMVSDQGGGTYSVTDDAWNTIYLHSTGVAVPPPGTDLVVTGIADQVGGVPLIRVSEAGDIQEAQ